MALTSDTTQMRAQSLENMAQEFLTSVGIVNASDPLEYPCHVAKGRVNMGSYEDRPFFYSKLSQLQYPIADFVKICDALVILECPFCQQTNCNGTCGVVFGHPAESDDKFSKLPQEIKCAILSHLPLDELCRVVPFVCREWRLLAYDSSLWTKFKGDDVSSVMMAYLFRRSGHALKHLILDLDKTYMPWAYETDIEFEPLESGPKIVGRFCPLISKLDLSAPDDVFTPTVVTDALQKTCPNVKELTLRYFTITEDVIHALSKWEHLEVIDLFLSEITVSAVKVLATASQVCSGLALPWNCDAIDANLAIARSNVALQKLSIFRDCKLNDNTGLELSNCHALEILDIKLCRDLSDKFLTGIKYLANLTRLSLFYGGEFSAEGLTSLFKDGNLNNLTYLDLYYCVNVDDNVVTAALDRCGAKLVNLNLNWCKQVTVNSCVQIVNKCGALQQLTLNCDNINDDSWVKDIPKKMPQLTKLHVVGLPLSDESRQLLEKNKPGLDIDNTTYLLIG